MTAEKEKRYTVFLVEDDRDDKNILVQTLLSSPYIRNVFSFENGDMLFQHISSEEDACRKAIESGALVLLDVRLPGKSGIEILEKLKSNKLTSAMRVAMTTGDDSAETKSKAERFDIDAYIKKPVTLESVHKALRAG